MVDIALLAVVVANSCGVGGTMVVVLKTTVVLVLLLETMVRW